MLNAPKKSLKTAKQTLENCQENLQTLGDLLHKTVAQSQSVHIQTRLPAPEAEPVSPGVISRRDGITCSKHPSVPWGWLQAHAC